MKPTERGRNALGRGLAALIPQAPAAPGGDSRRGPLMVAIEEIDPQADQPRRSFDEARLTELADSIRAHGVIQPIIVRRDPGHPEGFVIVAGERRWRAAQRAGLKDLPVVLREASSATAFEVALIENIQRQDLNALEEAEAFRRLIEDYGQTQEQLAQRVGKDRATVANALRLLKLPPLVREMVADGRLAMGHARALLGVATTHLMETLARKVSDKKLSVRATEELVRKSAQLASDSAAATPSPATPTTATTATKNVAARDIEARLVRRLGTKVRLVENAREKGRGHLEIAFHSLDELDRLLDALLG